MNYALLPKPDQQIENILSYSPSEIHQFYNSTSLLNEGIYGRGFTIAIVDPYGDPTIAGDLKQFDATFGLPNPPSFNVLCIDGPCNYEEGILTGASVEIELDVEWSHAMAPGANINLYISSNFLSGPLYDAELAAVLGASGTAENVAGGIGTPGVYHNNIISNSFGEPENDYQNSQSYAQNYSQISGNGPIGYPWADQVFQEAAARNITVFASSGDYGAYLQGYPYLQTLPYGGINNPADDPFVTSVGGTSVYMKTTSGSLSYPESDANGGYGTETAWSWSNAQAEFPGAPDGATTGGFSSIFPRPAYEKGPGVPNSGARSDPDVSWLADPYTGVLVYGLSPYTGQMSFYGIGGTSVGSPSWAGVQALLDQYAGHSLGFMNPTFYSILNNPSEYSRAFHEVTFGNNDPFSATPGWNPTTGIGTPNIGELASVIAGKSPSLSVQVTNGLTRPVLPNSPTPAYTYRDTVTLSASINNHMMVSGPVMADLSSL
ncbi:MAG TPA: S53 family peptidase, partial [Nitrososphaerales archaeon]|nr:S53 family peptidase [Nitrososphaerales archaeon]